MENITLSKRLRLFAEVIGFVALAFAGKAAISILTWRFSGPVSLILLLLILTLYMRRVGLTWEFLGIKRLPTLKDKLMVVPKALLTFCAFAAAVALVLSLGKLPGFEFMYVIPDGVEERFAGVEGNIPVFLLWLGVVWTAAAFGEEMFFRGYLITRLHQVFEGSKLAPFLSVLIAATIFGIGHMYYQGLRGFITTGAIAIALGSMFLVFKRNLWPLILIHGVIDTLTFTALFLGLE